MRYVLAILAMSFSFCLISWHSLKPLSETNFSSLEKGRVLGVSEAAADFGFDPRNNLLSTLDLKRVSPPLLPLAVETKGRTVPKRKKGIKDIQIEAASGIVLDEKSNQVLFSKQSDKSRPIASITKLLAALTFLDYYPGWEDVYRIKEEDIVHGGRIYLRVGDEVSLRDLFNLALIASSNTAAKSLAGAVEESEEKFVAAMNRKARELGLKQTQITEPTGICPQNISTASEVAFLLKKALEKEEIKKTLTRTSYSFKTAAGRAMTVYNTDVFLTRLRGGDLAVLGGKTGFTKKAGYCFAAEFKKSNRPELITVILGAAAPYRRFSEAKKLADWAYRAYEW